jgi:hypothetical protein
LKGSEKLRIISASRQRIKTDKKMKQYCGALFQNKRMMMARTKDVSAAI